MKWNYQIIKDGDEYFLGEVFDGKSWAEVGDTRSENADDLLDDLQDRWTDAFSLPILEVKNNKLYEPKKTRTIIKERILEQKGTKRVTKVRSK